MIFLMSVALWRPMVTKYFNYTKIKGICCYHYSNQLKETNTLNNLEAKFRPNTQYKHKYNNKSCIFILAKCNCFFCTVSTNQSLL